MKASQHFFLAPNETPNPTLIPIWTAISESLRSPTASDKLSKKSAGPGFGFGAGTVGLRDLGASYSHGVSRPFASLQEKKNNYKKLMLLASMICTDLLRKMSWLVEEIHNT